MARLTRKELKSDRVAVELEHGVDYITSHQRQIVRYGVIALAIVLVALGVYFYRGQQHAVRQADLGRAIQIRDAPVGIAMPGVTLNYATQEAKDKDANKAFSDIVAKFSGSDEALIAKYYLGAIALDQGKMGDAEKSLKQVADSNNKNYAPLAKLSLGQIYFLDGRSEQGEKLLRSLMDHPAALVSKEQAAVALARALAPTRPADARKLLEPLRGERSAVSTTAITALSELPGQ